jgi:hypothetical protein
MVASIPMAMTKYNLAKPMPTTGSIEVENLAIADMTGLEAFKSITGLNCAGNELTQLVLRYHAALESLIAPATNWMPLI